LGIAVEKLLSDVEETLLFKHLHGRIDKAVARATQKLRDGKVDAEVLADQDRIAVALRTMAHALQDALKQADFAQQRENSAAGGGQGGQARPQPLVPPAAELRLLRGLQQEIYDQTKALADAPPTGNREQTVLELSTQQRELSSLGRDLIPEQAPENQDEEQP
jgi:hypothetical protein